MGSDGIQFSLEAGMIKTTPQRILNISKMNPGKKRDIAIKIIIRVWH